MKSWLIKTEDKDMKFPTQKVKREQLIAQKECRKNEK
jgi:hypothetical protein